MNTPAHIIVNLLILGKKDEPKPQFVIAADAALPDLPIIAFYAIEKLMWRTPEAVIWTERYYQEGWQNVIDTFNSLPLLLVGFLPSWRAKIETGILLIGSMILILPRRYRS